MRLIDADKLMENLRGNVLVDVTSVLEDAIAEQPTVNDVISIAMLKTVLKETYLEVANEYDVSDLHHDSDKVVCVASRFRSVALEKISELRFIKERR